MRVGVDLSSGEKATYDEGGALLLVRAGQDGHGVHDLDTSVIVDVDAVGILLARRWSDE